MKKGWIVSVLFSDHAIEHRGSLKDNKPLNFTVYGKVKSAKGKHIIIFTWEHSDKDCCELNSETAKILKSAIINWKRLKPA